eukprot:tig00000551_g2033.t1
MEDLDDALLSLILTRVRDANVTSVALLARVCKRWRAIVDDARFWTELVVPRLKGGERVGGIGSGNCAVPFLSAAGPSFSLERLLCQRRFALLAHLDLRAVPEMVDAALMRGLGAALPCLSSVALAVPAGRDTLLGMQALAPRLRRLRLAYTGGARLEGRASEELRALLAGAALLEALHLERWPATDDCLRAASAHRRLRDARLRLCNRVTDEGVEALLRGCPALELLKVESCLLVRWRWARSLLEAPGGAPAPLPLRALWVSEAAGLDALVAAVAPLAPRLAELHAASCTPVHPRPSAPSPGTPAPPRARCPARHLTPAASAPASRTSCSPTGTLRRSARRRPSLPCPASASSPSPRPPARPSSPSPPRRRARGPPRAPCLRAAGLARCGAGALLSLGRLPALALLVTSECAVEDAASALAAGAAAGPAPALRELVVRECAECSAARGPAFALRPASLLRILALAPRAARLTLTPALHAPPPPRGPAPAAGRDGGGAGRVAGLAGRWGRGGRVEVRVLERAGEEAEAALDAAFPSR